MFNKVPKLRCRKDKGIQERESLSLQTVIWKGSWIKCVTGWAVQDESGRRKFQEGKIDLIFSISLLIKKVGYEHFPHP